ncbi:hypothetical protein KQ945_18205 [Bacillus subtilis subsp. subtilis]|nr:hypothetical protein [Bacillus subtilis subsp. subtilis]
MATTALSLADLNGELDTLEAALLADDHDRASLCLDTLHLNQARFLAQPGALDDVAGLSALEGRQQRIMVMMMSQRDEAARHLRQGVSAGRAAHAYLTAESLA